MAKKNKKKIQKKRQTKALKQRSQKKAAKKKISKRPKMPGAPGKMPPLSADQRKMAEFAEPLISLVNPTSMPEMQMIAALVQGFWQAYDEPDLEKRRELLEPLGVLLEEQDFETPSFETLSEYLLRRHIYFKPDSHPEEERALYSAEQLEEAAFLNLAEWLLASGQGTPGEEQLLIPEFSEEAAAPLAETQKSLLKQKAAIEAEMDTLSFLDPQNPVLLKILDFQNQLVEAFSEYLGGLGLSEKAAAIHKANISPFFDPYLREYHQASFFSVTPEHLEEYILDYFLRKTEHEPVAEKVLLKSFAAFWELARNLGLISDASALEDRLEECEEEYLEMIEPEEAEEEAIDDDEEEK